LALPERACRANLLAAQLRGKLLTSICNTQPGAARGKLLAHFTHAHTSISISHSLAPADPKLQCQLRSRILLTLHTRTHAATGRRRAAVGRMATVWVKVLEFFR
jgi:hypothetical protein